MIQKTRKQPESQNVCPENAKNRKIWKNRQLHATRRVNRFSHYFWVLTRYYLARHSTCRASKKILPCKSAKPEPKTQHASKQNRKLCTDCVSCSGSQQLLGAQDTEISVSQIAANNFFYSTKNLLTVSDRRSPDVFPLWTGLTPDISLRSRKKIEPELRKLGSNLDSYKWWTLGQNPSAVKSQVRTLPIKAQSTSLITLLGCRAQPVP